MRNKLSKDDYDNICTEYKKTMKEPLRPGQCLFNAIYTVRPDFADEIRGTNRDTFYKDITSEDWSWLSDQIEQW